MRLSLVATAALALAAADAARGSDAAQPIAEIVTFRLVPGSDVEAFLAAAAGMTPFLDSTGAALSRSLSADDTGLWTDYITWSSMAAAKTAADAMMARPEAAPFIELIDPDTVVLRHAPILFSIPPE